MKMFSPGSRTAQGSGHHNAPALGSSVLSQHGRSSGLACESTVVAGDGASRQHAAPPEEGEEVRAVMERMALVKLARHADQTQQELEKIRTRVDHEQLESFLSSSAQRRQHQQDTMVFIVGYQEKCGCRQQLLSQLSEVQEALESTRQAMEHLGTLHSALIALTSHTGSAKEKKRGRTKLEKSLKEAKAKIELLAENLQETQTDLKLKEENIKELQKKNNLKISECRQLKDELTLTKKQAEKKSHESETQKALLERKFRASEENVSRLEALLSETIDELNETRAQLQGEASKSPARETDIPRSGHHGFVMDPSPPRSPDDPACPALEFARRTQKTLRWLRACT
ncbi:unnamed protein product [Lampetra planeri]